VAQALLTDPARLRAWVRRLASGQAAGLTVEEQEALAEACFRLALHPTTPPGERLHLLRQAHECDPGHPRHAYHLACGYLRHGRLDETVEWLERVQRVCPESPRVWVHTSLLQRELHRRYREDERYEPAALLRRAATLMAAVEQGAERVEAELLDLHPPTITAAAAGAGRTPAAPPGDPRRCHWTGVHDLLAEELLEAPASAATRDRLLPRLEQVALESANRDGGVAAFAILGVMWVLGGYPVAAVRRLRLRLPPDAAGGSLDLLELVCELYEVEPGEVAPRLAAALRDQRIPLLPASLVHHRRVLGWQRLRFPGLRGPYQAASAFLAEASTPWGAEAEESSRQAAELADQLLGAAQALEAEPPAPLPDAPPVTRTERLAHAEGLIDQAEHLAEQARKRKPELARLVATGPEHGLDETARQHVVQARAQVEQVEALVTSAMDLLSAVREAGDAVTSSEALEKLEDLEDRGRRARQLGPVRKVLSKLGSVTAAARQPVAGEAEGAADVPREAAATDGHARLREALRQVDRRVDELFARAEASFDPYGEDLRRWPPMAALRALVLARRAEALYRLGRRRQARRRWRQMQLEDPGQPAIARNIAVADSTGADQATQLSSWRAYLELLYANTILTGSLSTYAAERAELHRAFAGAYAPRLLAVQPSDASDEEEDEPALAAFLTSRQRLRSFTRHSLLAFLSERLNLDSPTLLLGVARTEDEDARVAARSSLLDFITTACAPLPPRVREGYVRVASNRVEAAFTASRATERRTLAMDPTYADERERHLTWLQSVCELKARVGWLVRGHDEVLEGLDTLAFLDELILLDRIPLTSSSALLATIRSRLRARDDDPSLQGAMGRLREEVLGWFPGKARTWA
jgi:hypothetical protein